MKWTVDERGWKGGSYRIVGEDGGPIAYVIGKSVVYKPTAITLAAAPELLKASIRLLDACPDNEKSEEWWEAYEELKAVVERVKEER